MNIKKKRILFVVGIMILVCCVFAGSYSFWTVTKEQNDTNNLVAACLDLELIEETGTFGVNNAWPISDEEGLELEGYSFKVKNNCSETVNYIIGIDSLAIEGAEYLSYDSIKVSLDNASPKVFGSLTNIERDNVRGSKQVDIKTIEGNTTNSHNIKLWIKNEADVSEQSKQFKGQVFITGGQGINLPQKRIIATGDVSKTETCQFNDVATDEVDKKGNTIYKIVKTCTPEETTSNVTYTLDEDGVLTISGPGQIKDYYYTMEIEKLDANRDDVGTYEDILGYNNIMLDIINKYLKNNNFNLYDYSNDSTMLELILSYINVMNGFEIQKDEYEIEYIPSYKFSEFYVANVGEEITDPIYLELSSLMDVFPKISKIIISEGITGIGENAFSCMPVLEENALVQLPESLETIGDFAFYESGIDVQLPSDNGNLNSIGYRAFSYMKKITNLDIPNTVTSIGYSESEPDELELVNQSHVDEIHYPKNNSINYVNTYGAYDFKNVYVPDNITELYTSGLNDKGVITNIYFEGSERTIYNNYGGALDLTPYNVIWNYTE